VLPLLGQLLLLLLLLPLLLGRQRRQRGLRRLRRPWLLQDVPLQLGAGRPLLLRLL
jgi:hypothetical protein